MSAPVKGRLPPDAAVNCDAVFAPDPDDADPPAAFVTGAFSPPPVPIFPPVPVVPVVPPLEDVDPGEVVGGEQAT